MKEQGICVLCKTNKQFNKGKNYGYRKYCERCYKYKVSKEVCQECGFIPKHVSQMDVHHLDENHENNSPENILVLCANCHRLKHCNFLPR